MLTLFIGVSTYFISDRLTSPNNLHSTIEIEIPRGTSLARTCEILTDEDIIPLPYFIVYPIARIMSEFSERTIQPGTITVQPDERPLDILLRLFKQRTFLLTIPEGMRLTEIASLVQKKNICDSAEFMSWTTSEEVLTGLGLQNVGLEGYLMPDTYEFFAGSTPRDIILRLAETANKRWAKDFAPLVNDGRSRHEILTLASIIEAETPVNEEKKRVGGVYTNRLRRGMKLEADPTVQYALGTRKSRLLYRDLEINSPYNTYQREGLPPGPINSPGTHAIEAAIQPEQHDYYFFVAAADGSLRHIFTRNGEEHARAVRTYRKRMGY